MNKMIALDVESGGIGPDKTLLTAYLVVLDENFNMMYDLDLKICPPDGIYHVTAEALSINKIDIVEHDKSGLFFKEAGTALYNFLAQSAPKERLIPIGHGVMGDCKLLKSALISAGSWDKFVSYQGICTSSVYRFMVACGKMPELSGSLESLVEYFGIKIVGHPHNAKSDTWASVEVLKRLLELNK